MTQIKLTKPWTNFAYKSGTKIDVKNIAENTQYNKYCLADDLNAIAEKLNEFKDRLQFII